MNYMGGKVRLAKHIAPFIINTSNTNSEYLEPFLGGGSVAAAVASSFNTVTLADASPDLMMMWAALADGWTPPSTVSEEHYWLLKAGQPSPERGFVGFACSYGGKWFGGFARSAVNQPYAAQGARRLARVKQALPNYATYVHSDYRAFSPGVGCTVYCDPPYAGTSSYRSVGVFDTEAFWATANRWCDSGATVFVSETSAPSMWSACWSRPVTRYTQRTGLGIPATESLFIREDFKGDK